MIEKFLEKLPLYNFLNMLHIGAIFSVFLLFVFQVDITNLPKIDTGFFALIAIGIFIAIYEIGYVVFRVGGTIVEKTLKLKVKIRSKKYSIIPFNEDYGLFNDLRKSNPFLNTLSREYAYARTQATLFLIISVVLFIKPIGGDVNFGFMTLVLVWIFVWTARKHAKKIVDIMEHKHLAR